MDADRTLTVAELGRLRRHYVIHGMRATARAIGLSRSALQRLLDGERVHRGTVLIARAALAAMEATDAA